MMFSNMFLFTAMNSLLTTFFHQENTYLISYHSYYVILQPFQTPDYIEMRREADTNM